MKLNIHSHKYSETYVQDLLIKAEKKIKERNFSEFKWINEYQDALIKYVELVFKAIGEGLALKLDVNPKDLKKSIRINVDTLIKIVEEETPHDLFYKSLFSDLRKKYGVATRFFEKYGFNKGKPLAPIKFKGKITYNPETKDALTNEEWSQVTDDVVEFLDDKIGDLEEETVVRSGLFGKLAQMMDEEGIPAKEQKKMSFSDIEKKFGKVPLDIKKAKRQFEMKDPEVAAIEYAQQKAGEYLSIEEGSLKSSIVNAVRKQIVGGLQDGISKQEMAQRLFWIDPRDVLGTEYNKDTIDAINRDWRRIAITEMSFAFNNGYMVSKKVANDERGKKTYLVFSGGIVKNSSDKCIDSRGEIVLVVDKPLTNDKIKDPYAKRAVWPGKNNVGRSESNWWIAIPMHPNCIHYWEEIDPTEQYWDEETEGILFKEDE